jgi:argininosuccinate lyase
MTKEKKNSSNKMWGGRFDAKPSEIMQEINQSISFDYKLYKQDIKGSKAHAKMLCEVGILTKVEAKKITDGLNKIEAEIESGKFKFKIELEDIHMNIESRLKEIIGDVAGKLHTARSRNDQVATDFRLFVRDEIDEIKFLLTQLEKNLVEKAEKNLDVITGIHSFTSWSACTFFTSHVGLF